MTGSTNTPRRLLRREDGAAAVEFALLVPLLLTLVMGAIDIGRAFYTHVSMVEAAQEGAVYASFNPTDYTATRSRVVNSVDDPVIASNDVTVTCPAVKVIKVRAVHRMQLMTPLIAQWFGSNLTVAGEAEARVLHATLVCVPTP